MPWACGLGEVPSPLARHIIVVRQKGLLECCLWETIVLPSAHSPSSDEEVVVGICKSLK